MLSFFVIFRLEILVQLVWRARVPLRPTSWFGEQTSTSRRQRRGSKSSWKYSSTTNQMKTFLLAATSYSLSTWPGSRRCGFNYLRIFRLKIECTSLSLPPLLSLDQHSWRAISERQLRPSCSVQPWPVLSARTLPPGGHPDLWPCHQRAIQQALSGHYSQGRNTGEYACMGEGVCDINFVQILKIFEIYRVCANRTQVKRIITILPFARFSGKGRHNLH